MSALVEEVFNKLNTHKGIEVYKLKLKKRESFYVIQKEYLLNLL